MPTRALPIPSYLEATGWPVLESSSCRVSGTEQKQEKVDQTDSEKDGNLGGAGL